MYGHTRSGREFSAYDVFVTSIDHFTLGTNLPPFPINDDAVFGTNEPAEQFRWVAAFASQVTFLVLIVCCPLSETDDNSNLGDGDEPVDSKPPHQTVNLREALRHQDGWEPGESGQGV